MAKRRKRVPFKIRLQFTTVTFQRGEEEEEKGLIVPSRGSGTRPDCKNPCVCDSQLEQLTSRRKTFAWSPRDVHQRFVSTFPTEPKKKSTSSG